jgi:hypothetical protein
MDTAPVAYQSATALSTPMYPMTIVKPRWGLGSDLTRTVSRRWRGGRKTISTGGLVKNNHGASPRSIVLPAMDLRINDSTSVLGNYQAPLRGEVATQTTLADDNASHL